MRKILVFNTGSTSIKYKLFEFEDKKNLYEIKQGSIDRIGLQNGPKNYKTALFLLFEGIGITMQGISQIQDLVAIAHRVVHCGDKYTKTTCINEEVINTLHNYNLIAPLHNPQILEVMRLVLEQCNRLTNPIANYAVFDSVFFKDLPKVTKLYPLPYKYYTDYGIQRFGFHGITHQYCMENILARHPKAKKIITIHLGGGSSITAVKNGKPIDTSMGFTPLEGLMMESRCGNVDSGIIHYLIERRYLTHRGVDKMINFESGLWGVSGIDASIEDLLNIAGYKVEDPNFKPEIAPSAVPFAKVERAKLAFEMYAYRIKKYIGEYYAILGGLDVLAFTGKVGFGSSVIRNMVLRNLEHITKDVIIEAIETQEETQIAKEILKVIK